MCHPACCCCGRPFDGLDWENHSRLTNICDVEIVASDLITGHFGDYDYDENDADGGRKAETVAEELLSIDRVAEPLEDAENKLACNGMLLSVHQFVDISAQDNVDSAT